MPKGHKSNHGYASVADIEDAQDYRTIAKKMSESGSKMNHATARNIVLRALKKLTIPLTESYDNTADVDEIVKDPRFQSGLADILEELSQTNLDS